jgi:hypothetical protein
VKEEFELMKRSLLAIFLMGVLLLFAVTVAQAVVPDAKTLRSWVEAMKGAQRGPFERIRWFCNDGTIQPPKAYACSGRGGGVQHGEWSDRTKILRARGYYIANVLADIKPKDFLSREHQDDILKQILLEQFLINADDGWIFRGARYYWGALQAEDEEKSARDLLLSLVKEMDWRNSRFPVLREAVRLLPHGRKGAPVTEMRQLSRSIAEKDEGFKRLRVKIHARPDAGDAERVRAYAADQGISGLSADYQRLAVTIEEVYQPQGMGNEILSLAGQVKDPKLGQALKERATQLSEQKDPSIRLAAASQLLAVVRDDLWRAGSPEQMLDLLDASLGLEGEVYRYGNNLLERLTETTRRERLLWLKNMAAAIYGVGLISEREWHALRESFTTTLTETPLPLITYKNELDYVSRVSGWADRLLRFHFSETVVHLSEIEPLTLHYIHDRLHISPLLLYAEVLDSLIEDANGLIGIRHELFGQKVAGGLRGLNAGLTRGVLRFPREGEKKINFDRRGIYVLEANTRDLPPVAGIVTTGQGNSLSHVQLLARNLSIPNVGVDKRLLPRFAKKEGRRVVMAVSPLGVVRLVEDSGKWDSVFEREEKPSGSIIRPNLEKLDLNNRNFISLQHLRASDSGRIVGPKAANLGELKDHFPVAVPDGLVVPFGIFKAILDQPMEPGGPTVFRWMQEQYAAIQDIKGEPQRREEEIRRFLKRIRDWIINSDPGPQFRDVLRGTMGQLFGIEGTYGVFVRSDTNVEDLPGFTGAGLNLTVPHVVGFENVLKAIRRVWASPFTERAYQWRQGHMNHPEHVYVSVLLMRSVPAEKSGVMVTADLESGHQDWLSVAVNEGVGGAVDGQAAEELRVGMKSGKVRLLSQATEQLKRVLLPQGGVAKIQASGTAAVLNREEIHTLVNLVKSLPTRFPMPRDEQGLPAPADIEFGFHDGSLALFQIRPFVESSRARRSLFLKSLDRELHNIQVHTVDLDKVPPVVFQ